MAVVDGEFLQACRLTSFRAIHYPEPGYSTIGLGILLCAVQEPPLKALASGVARHLVGELTCCHGARAENVA